MHSFRYAWAGLREVWRTERNVRIHGAFVVAITALGLLLRLPAEQWAILVLTFSLVLATEFLNSALEALTDLACPNYHPLAARAKDIAAGAVLVTAFGAIIVGLLILGPPLWAQLLALAS
jgi:diacylglycerol kinase (ATP)